MLALHDEAVNRFAEPEIAGTVRVGTPDDYADALLPLLFSRFAETYPKVHLEIRCDQSPQLLSALGMRASSTWPDLARSGVRRGHLVRSEPVVWATSPNHRAHAQDPVPLALFLQDCKFHQWALGALDTMGKPYRLAYTSPNLAALSAAVSSGLAVTAVAQSSLSRGMRVLGEKRRLSAPAHGRYRLGPGTPGQAKAGIAAGGAHHRHLPRRRGGVPHHGGRQAAGLSQTS